MQGRDVTKLSALSRALSHPTRIRVLLALQEKGEQCAGDLTRVLRRRQSSVSQHLAILRRHGLVRTRRNGRYVFYSVAGTQLDRVRKALERLLPAQSRGRRRQR